MNLRVVRGFCKAAKRPYMKLFTSDYRDGTARLSFELQGFYARVLTLLHDGESVPADPRKLGVMMQCDPRVAARLTKGLIDAGKLYEKDGTLRNKRIDRDYVGTSDEDPDNFDQTSPELRADIPEKSGETFQKTESNQQGENHYYGEGHCHSHSQKKNPTTLSPRTPRVEKPIGRPGMEFWSKAMTPEPPAEHKTVTMEDGQIVLHNGTRAKWLAEFGDDAKRLDLALTQAAAWIQPNSSRPLQAQVEGQLARAVSEKLDRDKRYQAAANKAAPAGSDAGGTRAMEILKRMSSKEATA